MAPTLLNKLALLATNLEEQVEHVAMNGTSSNDEKLAEMRRDARYQLDDRDVQDFLEAQRKAGSVRFKRLAVRLK